MSQRSVSESEELRTDVPRTSTPPQMTPEVWRAMQEALKGPQITPEVWRGTQEALKGPQITPEVWRGMQ